jgi:two-component system CheB/CheR fusion protein
MRASHAITVLFLDDDADALHAYRLIATGEGMIVETASDGREAIALADTLLPDVIVLDIGLRRDDGLDGFEVARRLRASARTSTTPLVFVSGYNSADHVAAMQSSGCDGHLVKPCSADGLLGLITELAKKRGDRARGSDAAATA